MESWKVKVISAPESHFLFLGTGAGIEQVIFVGSEKDNVTDLNYLGARYYLLSYGKFISQDPVFLSPS